MAPRSASGASKNATHAAIISKRTVFRGSSPKKSPMKKTHLIDLFVSESDIGVCTKLMDDIEGQILLDSVHVPGSTEVHIICKDFAKRNTKRIIKWILKLVKAGWSFSGKITAEDFVVTPLRQIKVSAKRLDDLQPATKEGTRADMHSIASVITAMFSANKGDIPFPYNLKHLLKLLKKYKKIYALLLERHPLGLKEYEYLCLFNLLYMRVDVLKKENRAEYDEIIKRLPHCKPGKLHWMNKVMQQLYFMKILVYQKPLGARKKNKKATKKKPQKSTKKKKKKKKQHIHAGIVVAYKPDGGNMLRLIRNGVQHLPQEESVYLMKFFRNKKSFLRRVILFRYYQMGHMIAQTLPKLVCRLQKVMHCRGHFQELLQ